ncbi:MAG TPA: glycosyltransferase family 1 protein [Acidimicrobiales bacterium]
MGVRVALDVSAVPPKIAGAGRYIAELAKALPAREVATTLVTRRDDTTRWQDLAPGTSVSGLVPNARVARLAYEAWMLGTSKVARNVDLWHAPHYTMPHRGSTPTVVTIHDLTFFTNSEWHERSKVAFFRRAITYSAKHARVLVSVSDFSARLIEEIVPVHAPIVVAPLGVDLIGFRPSGEDDVIFNAHRLSVDTPYIFFVGTVEPRKGLDVLLRAFSEVARDDDDVELWLAGQVGWGDGTLEAQFAAHPFKARIRHLGFVDDALLPALYRQAKAVAYPSRGEGFGLPVLEAMACGALVVTTKDTVMAEVAGDGARLVAAGDDEELASSLLDALQSGPSERLQWASRARQRAEHFTWDYCVDQHIVAYQQAVGTP